MHMYLFAQQVLIYVISWLNEELNMIQLSKAITENNASMLYYI